MHAAHSVDHVCCTAICYPDRSQIYNSQSDLQLPAMWHFIPGTTPCLNAQFRH